MLSEFFGACDRMSGEGNAHVNSSWPMMTKTQSVHAMTAQSKMRSQAHEAAQYVSAPTPETNCIDFEPDSRSRTGGVTKEAATKEKGTRIRIAAKMETNEETFAWSSALRGRSCVLTVSVEVPFVAARNLASCRDAMAVGNACVSFDSNIRTCAGAQSAVSYKDKRWRCATKQHASSVQICRADVPDAGCWHCQGVVLGDKSYSHLLHGSH